MKKVQIENCTLYCGDSKQIIPALVADGFSADCACLDPPYLLTSGGTPEGGLHERLGGEGYENGGHLVACDIDWPEIMQLVYSAMGRGHAYVMANNRNVQPMLNAARWPSGKTPKTFMELVKQVMAAATNGDRQPIYQKIQAALGEQTEGFEFHNLLVWDKVSATPNRWYMKNCEFTGLFYKGKAVEINNCGSMSLTKFPQKDESDHPTEKPVPLMEHYIRNSTQPGQMVFDPFMGSGTTGVAAARLGRAFVGIELDEKHFESAVRRITEAHRNMQSNLF